MPKDHVQVPHKLWKAVSFFINGAAIMETFKHDKPDLHEQVVSMSKLIDEVNKGTVGDTFLPEGWTTVRNPSDGTPMFPWCAYRHTLFMRRFRTCRDAERWIDKYVAGKISV